MTSFDEVAFVKGHGTANDFVLIPDHDGGRDLTPAQVRWLCDRHRGLGADGVLRVVRTEHVEGYSDWSTIAEWFMDYRNADGSVAEMCGNGARVFVRYLVASGLVESREVTFGTRGGLRTAVQNGDLSITVDMGSASQISAADGARVEVGDLSWPVTGVQVPNPHAVVVVGDLAEAGDLRTVPGIVPATAYPDGANVEFLVPVGPRHVRMRVHERGVGETLSCGTGACAVAWAARRLLEPDVQGETTYRVDVPGGTVEVTETEGGSLLLTGPADLVARGKVLIPS